MGSFSDSPGTIYPALRRLQSKGLVKSGKVASPGRRRQLVTLTPKGTTELKKWIRRPVTRQDVISGLREFMLRFAYSEPVIGASVTIELLNGLKAELGAVVRGLHDQMNTPKPGMPLSGTLALESGVRGHECLLEWCEYALRVYKRERH